MDFISGIFTPILPALAGAGLLKGFLALFTTVGWLTTESDTYMVLNAIGDSVFYFLPFFLAVSTARKMRTNEYLALIVAGTLMYPSLIEAFNAIEGGGPDTLDFLGLGIINIPLLNYDTSVIPVILSVILLKYVYDLVKKSHSVCNSANVRTNDCLFNCSSTIPMADWTIRNEHW